MVLLPKDHYSSACEGGMKCLPLLKYRTRTRDLSIHGQKCSHSLSCTAVLLHEPKFLKQVILHWRTDSAPMPLTVFFKNTIGFKAVFAVHKAFQIIIHTSEFPNCSYRATLCLCVTC